MYIHVACPRQDSMSACWKSLSNRYIVCMKYCSSVLYYQLLGSLSDVGHCVNLWFTSNKATALLPTNLLHVPDRTA